MLKIKDDDEKNEDKFSLKKFIEDKYYDFRWKFVIPIFHFFKIQHKSDWWSAYTFMSKAILPYLRAFQKNEKHGYPCTLYTYFKDEIEKEGFIYDSDTGGYKKPTIDKLDDENFDWFSKKWQWVIDEVVFALEHCAYENDDDCEVPNEKYDPKQKNPFSFTPCKDSPGCSTMNFNDDYGKTKQDHDLYTKKMERVSNGLILMGQFWQSFWD